MSKEQSLEDYQRQVLREINNEVQENDVLWERCRVVAFTSMSVGRGRRRRVPKYIELLVVDNSYAHVIEKNQILPRTKNDHIAIDVLANELLIDEYQEDRTVDRLLERARNNLHRRT